MSQPLRIMIVDDESPARMRLKDLLADIQGELPNQVVAEATDGVAAVESLEHQNVDVMLVDIRMPRMNGIELAQHLSACPQPPVIIFTTAYDQYAVQAFELAALDYLLKPVRANRLLTALHKMQRIRPEQLSQIPAAERQFLHSMERGRMSLVPVTDILYLRAELKYVTARTAERDYLVEESLNQLEQELGTLFIRAHRNCLVARRYISGYERMRESEAGAETQWALRLGGLEELIPVSRRQWAQVKALIKEERK